PHPGGGDATIGAAQGAADHRGELELAREWNARRIARGRTVEIDLARGDRRKRAGAGIAKRQRCLARVPERAAQVVEVAEGRGAPAMAGVVAAHHASGALERRGVDHLGAALENVAPRALLVSDFGESG